MLFKKTKVINTNELALISRFSLLYGKGKMAKLIFAENNFQNKFTSSLSTLTFYAILTLKRYTA